MNTAALKDRVQARDRLLHQAELAGQRMGDEIIGALARGELAQAASAAQDQQAQLLALSENLRIYQAELHAQADELAASQARTAEVLERFATLFASMPVAAMLVADNGQVLEHNLQAASTLQLRALSSGGRFMHRLVDPQQFQERVRPAFLQARAEGNCRLDGLRFIDEAGRRFDGELHIARLAGRGPGDVTYACAVIDRTEQLQALHAAQQAAEALRQSESFLADAARVARTGGWELTLRPREMRWSAQLRQVLELAPEETATLETLLGRCAHHDRVVLAGAFAAAELGEPFEVELDMRGASGRVLRVLAVGHVDREPRSGRSGGPAGVLRVHGVLQDITTQHQVRRQLGDLSERLAIANDAGGIGVWDCDLQRGELLFDARLCQMLGLSAGPGTGGLADALRLHLLPDSTLLLEQALEAALQRLEPLNLELHLADGPAGERWLHLTGRAHPDAAGRVVRLVGCAWDSSPQHEALRVLAAKEAAESASRAKSAFLSRMSHELRTPLNAILGFAQLMRMQAEAGDLELKPHRVTLIESAARHLLDLVNEVLDVSRIETGRVEVQLTPFTLQEVLHEALPLVEGLAERTGVRLGVSLPPDRPAVVLGDRLRLKEVLINLLSNAVKYNVPGGEVVVSVALEAGQVVLRVADTGRGMDSHQVANLFQPFNRVGAESTGIEGSGMGLFVSQRFMELMGGRIEVQSQPGAGTTFSVKLHQPPAGG